MKKFLNRAIARFIEDNGAEPPKDTTFELLGPKINGNPEKVAADELRIHGCEQATEFPTIEDILNSDDPFKMLEPIFADFRVRNIEGSSSTRFFMCGRINKLMMNCCNI